MCDFIFNIKKDSVESISALTRCLFAFATPIKLYFNVVFKLLPYVALAFGATSIFICKYAIIAAVKDSVRRANRTLFLQLFYFLLLYLTKIELIIKSKATRISDSISYDISREFSQNSKHKI